MLFEKFIIHASVLCTTANVLKIAKRDKIIVIVVIVAGASITLIPGSGRETLIRASHQVKLPPRERPIRHKCSFNGIFRRQLIAFSHGLHNDKSTAKDTRAIIHYVFINFQKKEEEYGNKNQLLWAMRRNH